MGADSDKATEAVVDWWRALCSDNGPSRASAARLRRCASVFDALLLVETHALIKAVRRSGAERLAHDADQRLAVLAMALAHVKEKSTTPFAAALGHTVDGRPPNTRDGERPRFSPARFGALMRAAHARDWDGFARALRRAFAILGDSAFHVPGFIGDVLHMSDRTLQRWTYQYWQTNAPDRSDEPTDIRSSTDMEAVQ